MKEGGRRGVTREASLRHGGDRLVVFGRRYTTGVTEREEGLGEEEEEDDDGDDEKE